MRLYGSVYVTMFVCTRVHICVSVLECVSTYSCMRVYLCESVCAQICEPVCVFQVCLYKSVSECLCMSVWISIYKHECVYVCTHVLTQDSYDILPETEPDSILGAKFQMPRSGYVSR